MKASSICQLQPIDTKRRPSEPKTAPVSLRVARFGCFDDLAPWREQWNALTDGVPFRRWEWLESWWRHYGPGSRALSRRRGGTADHRSLFLLAVFDEAQSLVGVAPWYIDRSAIAGRVVRLLGDGEVCSEYVTARAAAGMERRVARALADWLNVAAARPHPCWDRLELQQLEAGDPMMCCLARVMAAAGHAVERQPATNCWRIELPDDWDEYLASLSKSHRKQIRQLDRNYLQTPRVVEREVVALSDLDEGFRVLVDLHQRRWRAAGEPGCFASHRFTRFHREVAERLLAAGMLQLQWLEIDGQPAAVEYHFCGNGGVFGYQAGMAPELKLHQPGRLIAIATLKQAIERGNSFVDYLRGDESYKAHLRAVERPMLSLQIVRRGWRPAARYWLAAAPRRLKASVRRLRVFASGRTHTVASRAT